MERSDALKMIVDQAEGKVIPYLQGLNDLLEPHFKSLNDNRFQRWDVGIDVVETMMHEKIIYHVTVYTPEQMNTHNVLDEVRKVDPKYQGCIGVTHRQDLYPTSSKINLELIKDLNKAFKTPME